MSIPLILISISLVIVGVFIFTEYRQRAIEDKVKGMGVHRGSAGFSVIIDAQGPWDFYEYLCTDKKECEQSPSSGKRNSLVSGVPVADQELVINYDESWENYKFVKVFARPVWGSGDPDYTAEKLDSSPEAAVNVLSENNREIEVLIVSVDSFKDNFEDSIAVFSNN